MVNKWNGQFALFYSDVQYCSLQNSYWIYQVKLLWWMYLWTKSKHVSDEIMLWEKCYNTHICGRTTSFCLAKFSIIYCLTSLIYLNKNNKYFHITQLHRSISDLDIQKQSIYHEEVTSVVCTAICKMSNTIQQLVIDTIDVFNPVHFTVSNYNLKLTIIHLFQ